MREIPWASARALPYSRTVSAARGSFWLLFGLLFPASSLADAGAGSAPKPGAEDPVVVRVGESEVRAGELEFLLRRLHEFENATYGKTPAEVKRGFVNRRLVPELLAAEEARRIGADQKPEIAKRIRSELGTALKDELAREADASITTKELDDYCRGSGNLDAGHASANCVGDRAGLRVALRRTKAAKEFDRLFEALYREHTREVRRDLLEAIVVTKDGVMAAPIK